MRAGARQFWASFFLTLGVLLPLVWCSFLWMDHARGTAPTVQAQSGVPLTPGSRETMTVLLAVAPAAPDQRPHLALAVLDCPRGRVSLCALPGDVSLLTPDGGTVTLAESYRTAGPARAAQLLAATLEIEQPAYLAATPAGWDALLRRAVRLDTTSLLETKQREKLGLEHAVAELTVQEAAALLEQPLPARVRDGLETALWDAFVCQCREELDRLPDAIRAHSSTLLCSLTAADLLRLDKALAYLAGTESRGEAAQMPGSRAGDRYLLDEKSLAFAAKLTEP